MTEIVDPIGAIITFLLADSATAVLCDTNVFGGAMPTGDDMPPAPNLDGSAKAIVIVSAAGGPEIGTANQFAKLRVDLACYGGSQRQSWLVYRTCRAALKALERVVVTEVLLHSAIPTTNGSTGIDPETNWPVCLGSFSVLHAEVSAT
jgi:hypothetical protein